MTYLILALAISGLWPFDDAALSRSRPRQERVHSAPQSRASRGPFKWWLDPDIRREIGLTKGQVDEIQAIYGANASSSNALLLLLTQCEREYQTLLQNEQPNDAMVLETIDRIEHARYELGKARAIMLYRFYKCLSRQQQVAFTRRFGKDIGGGRGPRL
jgi:hypothetical protein